VGGPFFREDALEIIGVRAPERSPVFDEVRVEERLAQTRLNILEVLQARFRTEIPAEVSAALEGLEDIARLRALLGLAATCRTLNQFRKELQGTKGGR
jgi:hypothetical protein